VSTMYIRTALCASLLVFCASNAHTQSAAAQPCDDGLVRNDWKQLVVVAECTVPLPGGGTATVHTTEEAELKGDVTVFVRGLAKFKDASTPPLDLHRIVLFLDRKPVKGPVVVLPGAGESSLHFTLTRGDDDRDAWHSLLSGAIRNKPVTLSIGFEGQSPVATEVHNFRLLAVPGDWLGLWFGLVGALLVVLFVAGKRTELLKDGNAGTLYYSLARTQMAVWFVVILASYMFIWLVTGELDSLTSTVIGLMGISAATAVAGTTMTSNAAQPTAANPAPAPRGFFKDILSDGKSVSLARLQIAAWTVILVIIFLRSVYQELTMPQFDATLLGLMGISNGTYLGFKGLEK
jgi:hypothetical protein